MNGRVTFDFPFVEPVLKAFIEILLPIKILYLNHNSLHKLLKTL